MNELLEGWTLAKLEELCISPRQDIVDGPFGSNLKASEYVDAGIPIIRLQNVKRNRFIEHNLRFITPNKADDLSRHSFRAGDIVITKLGSPLGEACLVPPSLEFGIIVADVVRARISENHISKLFTVFAINSPAVINQLSLEVKGSTRPRVNLSHIRSLEIPLAPLNEQYRIVAKLEKLLGNVEACQQRLEKIPRILKRFRQAILAAACSGKLTADWRGHNVIKETALEWLIQVVEKRRLQYEAERVSLESGKTKKTKRPNYLSYDIKDCEASDGIPSTWIKAPIGLLCDCIVPGRDKPNSFSGSIPWITLPDITNLYIQNSASGLYLTEEEVQEVNARIIPPESVIMSCIGRFGISAIVCTPLVVNQQLHAFLKSELILPEYLAYHIQTLERYMIDISTSTTISYLNKDNCNSLPINLPPLEEQHEIVRRVESLFKIADKLEERYRKAKEHVDKLTQSILVKAFRGELVPTEAELARQEGRDYEPASALIERIKHERALRQKSDKTSRNSRKRQSEITRDPPPERSVTKLFT
jgi:type I restriction enzyme S subunit